MMKHKRNLIIVFVAFFAITILGVGGSCGEDTPRKHRTAYRKIRPGSYERIRYRIDTLRIDTVNAIRTQGEFRGFPKQLKP